MGKPVSSIINRNLDHPSDVLKKTRYWSHLANKARCLLLKQKISVLNNISEHIRSAVKYKTKMADCKLTPTSVLPFLLSTCLTTSLAAMCGHLTNFEPWNVNRNDMCNLWVI